MSGTTAENSAFAYVKLSTAALTCRRMAAKLENAAGAGGRVRMASSVSALWISASVVALTVLVKSTAACPTDHAFLVPV